MLEGLLALVADEAAPVVVLGLAMVHEAARVVEDLVVEMGKYVI